MKDETLLREALDYLRGKATECAGTPLGSKLHEQAEALRRVLGRGVEPIVDLCPSCGARSLFIGKGGHLTCGVIRCREPGVGRAIRNTKAALQCTRDALAGVEQHAPGYDWNADPLGLTLRIGAAYARIAALPRLPA